LFLNFDCQSTRFRCWNESIDLKEKSLPQQGILSHYRPVALPVVWSIEAGLLLMVAASNGLLTEATRVLLARSISGIE
jgi:hypothetical protein